jgi:hypothetical protein
MYALSVSGSKDELEKGRSGFNCSRSAEALLYAKN